MILVELHGGGLHVRSLFVRWQHSLVVRQQPPLQAPHEGRVLQHRLQDARRLQSFKKSKMLLKLRSILVPFIWRDIDYQVHQKMVM